MLVKLLNEYAQLPTRGSKDAAGLDLYCPFHIKVPADSQKKIPLGVAVEIPKGYMGLLVPRSSMSKTPLRCANSVGVIGMNNLCPNVPIIISLLERISINSDSFSSVTFPIFGSF